MLFTESKYIESVNTFVFLYRTSIAPAVFEFVKLRLFCLIISFIIFGETIIGREGSFELDMQKQ